MIADLLRRIIYTIYGWRLSKVLICSISALVLWTILNSLVSKKIGKMLNSIALSGILIAILFFTITSRTPNYLREIKLTPFWSFTSDGSYQSAWLNAFFFLPLGLSLPYVLPDKIKHKAFFTIITAMFFSVMIESIQYIFTLGLCETDDVIMNTLGAAIGTLSYIVIQRINARKQ